MKSFFSVEMSNNSESITKKIGSISSSLKSMPSVLSKDLEMEGDICSFGIIEIEGKIKGTIKGNLVVIREEGAFNGEIDVKSVSIRGVFNGKIRSKNVSIFKKAKITGTIEYSSLSVEDGAYIDGQFKRIEENNKDLDISK